MRIATQADLPQFELMLRGYLAEQEAVGSPVLFTRMTLDWYRDLAWDYVTGSRFGVIVLGEVESEAGQEVVGFAMAGEGGQPHLDTNLGRVAVVWIDWVAPEHRKARVGVSMLLFGWPTLLEMGFDTAAMSVREGNEQGEALCRSFGAFPVERFFHYPLKEAPRGTRR